MATTPATDTDDETRREFVERVARTPPQQIRAIAESNYLVAANILSYNWIAGNPRADWEGKPFDWHPTPPHFRDWYDRIRANPLNMFLAARKHTKTTFADTLMIWKSEYVPGHTSVYWANTENQVRERMEEFEEIVDANPWLQNVGTDGALTSKSFENGSRILTTWVTGAFEGGHVDLMLGDDPMKEFSDIPDRDIEAWYGRVIVPTINPDGLAAIIGTRKRPNDLYELLRTKHEQDDALADLPSYTLTEYPAIREAWRDEYDRPGDLAPEPMYTQAHAPELASALGFDDRDTLSILWPEARSPEWLAKNLGGQGRPYFLREFCMIFKQAEDAVVHREWIVDASQNRVPPHTLAEPFTPIDYHEGITREAWDEVVVGIDPAGKGRDRFGFVTVGQLTHPAEAVPGAETAVTIRHILDVYQAQDVPPSAFRAKMAALTDRYHPDAIALESNLNQTWVADDEELPQAVRQIIEPIATSRSKHSWKDGVPRIGSDIEAGHYRFYVGGDDTNMTEELITALTSVQMHDGELQGHTPDLVMALYMAHKRLTDPSGHMAVSRTNLKRGKPTPEQEEREESAREKRRALKGSEIGDAILGNDDGSYY